MALPVALIGGLLKGIFGFIKPYIGFFLAYFKGRSEGHAKAKAQANAHFTEITNRVVRDRDAAASKRLRDPSDDDAHFRD